MEGNFYMILHSKLYKITCTTQVVFVLEELGLPYELKVIPFAAIKSHPFTDLNPNGRVPGVCPVLFPCHLLGAKS